MINLDVERCKLDAGLYVVATPIGNLKDITLRALEVLMSSDYIFCEDTRVTKKLLSHYNITGIKLFVYNDHSDDKGRENVKNLAMMGASIALVSDAGTPLVSDPGYKLVSYLQESGVQIYALPGPSSVMSAIVSSGLPSDKFFFVGFLPRASGARIALLSRCLESGVTSIIFESAKRIISLLELVRSEFGDVLCCIAREMTKKFEEVRKGTVSEVIQYYNSGVILKGEVVVMLNFASCLGSPTEDENGDLDDVIVKMLSSGFSNREVVDIFNSKIKISRNALYNRVMKLSKSSV